MNVFWSFMWGRIRSRETKIKLNWHWHLYTHRKLNLILIVRHAKGEITMLNYYYIVWTFYFTCQGLSTAEFPDVKVSRRHVLLSKSFTIGNKTFSSISKCHFIFRSGKRSICIPYHIPIQHYCPRGEGSQAIIKTKTWPQNSKVYKSLRSDLSSWVSSAVVA